jgi:hypothetical protein
MSSVILAAVLAFLVSFHGIWFLLITLVGSVPIFFLENMVFTAGDSPRVVLRQPTDYAVRFPTEPRER